MRFRSANLFDLIAAQAPPAEKIALETADATSLTYGELIERSGAGGERAGRARRRAGRPGRGADRQVGRRRSCWRSPASRRRGAPAAEHRLYAGRARIFPRRRRARADALPAGSGSSSVRDARDPGSTCRRGREPRRRARRNLRRENRRRAAEFETVAAREQTIWRRSFTPPARPAARRARC